MNVVLLPLIVGLAGPLVTRAAPSPTPATATSSPGAATEQSALAIELDVTALLEGESEASVKDTASFVLRDVETALQTTHGRRLADDTTTPTILITLSWVDQRESIYNIELRTRRPGEAPRLLETVACECIDSGLSEAIVDRLPEALAQLETEVEAPAPAPAQDDSPRPEPSPPPTPPEDHTREAPVLGPLGYGGIAVLAGGAAMSALGVTWLVRGDTRELTEQDEQQGDLRDYRPGGRAWLGVGLTTVGIGAAMLALDLTVLRSRRKAKLALTPTVHPTMMGLRMNARF